MVHRPATARNALPRHPTTMPVLGGPFLCAVDLRGLGPARMNQLSAVTSCHQLSAPALCLEAPEDDAER
jgi:hypothetical protein